MRRRMTRTRRASSRDASQESIVDFGGFDMHTLDLNAAITVP